MIPRLSEGGASFKGAALYYLADKREEGEAVRTTSARVAWTYTLNLPTQDPDRAWRMMAHTAMSQAELKAEAGIKATGRKLTKPVMAYSLAWSPDEEPPAPHAMLEAAQDSLAALGLELHQAIVICHNDTAHPHVHVIVNRVNPANGVAHTGSKTKLKLSAWAEAYERSQGRILCVERVENNARRHEGDRIDRAEKVSRPQWEAAQIDPDVAAELAAAYRQNFGDMAAVERAGGERRFKESTAFHAQRRAGRNAIRDRYQAALDSVRDPAMAKRHARIADALLKLDPGLGLETLTRDRSTFTRQDLVRHVGRHTGSVDEFLAVLDRLESSPELVPLGRDADGQQRFTTREHQALEQRMLDRARELQTAPHRAVRPLWPKGISLSKDQDAALRHVVNAGGLAQIIGVAGSGKSTLLAGARRSWEASGLQVQGMALSGIAADGLKAGSGIDSRTIHSRLHQWEQGINRPGRKDVIVVDEAGMIGSRQMERILHYAVQGGAKVVLVGDPEQLQAIEAGGAFRMTAERFGAADLQTVRRQKADWQQEATRDLAATRTAAAMARYEAAGMVHAHDTRDAAKADLIAKWRQARLDQPKATQIILSFLRADVRDLNDRARAVLREAGELGPEVKLRTADGSRHFAAGDRIYFVKNDAGLGVRNGTLATIVRIKGHTVVAKLDGDAGREIMFGMGSYNHIDHGYAATIHKSQGVTVDRAHLFASKNLDRHGAYVAMTRHRDRLDVHWSADSFGGRARFLRSVSRAAAKDTSLDYQPAPPTEEAHLAERADRVHSIRLQMRKRFGEPRTAEVQPAQRIGQKAIAELRRAAANHDQRVKPQPVPELRPAITPEPPRPSDRVSVLVTAEMQAHDHETAALLRAMDDRHAAEIAAEQIMRERLTIGAAIDWNDALNVRPEPKVDIEDKLKEALRQKPPRGPKPSL